MKAVFTLMALATLAFAQDIAPRWGGGQTDTTTWTVFTTTTYCPVTSTKTEASSQATLHGT
jgi:hypothetical protein